MTENLHAKPFENLTISGSKDQMLFEELGVLAQTKYVNDLTMQITKKKDLVKCYLI